MDTVDDAQERVDNRTSQVVELGLVFYWQRRINRLYGSFSSFYKQVHTHLIVGKEVILTHKTDVSKSLNSSNFDIFRHVAISEDAMQNLYSLVEMAVYCLVKFAYADC